MDSGCSSFLFVVIQINRYLYHVQAAEKELILNMKVCVRYELLTAQLKSTQIPDISLIYYSRSRLSTGFKQDCPFGNVGKDGFSEVSLKLRRDWILRKITDEECEKTNAMMPMAVTVVSFILRLNKIIT
jgi:hypothetical protein